MATFMKNMNYEEEKAIKEVRFNQNDVIFVFADI